MFDANGDVPASYDILNMQISPDNTFQLMKVGKINSRAMSGKEVVLNMSAILWSDGSSLVVQPLKLIDTCNMHCRSSSKAALAGQIESIGLRAKSGLRPWLAAHSSKSAGKKAMRWAAGFALPHLTSLLVFPHLACVAYQVCPSDSLLRSRAPLGTDGTDGTGVQMLRSTQTLRSDSSAGCPTDGSG
ncbi:hypothetical protein NDU88_009334 [Pleurodeles waltl]|uniref:Uncharacterized protein n=1 Tax=Pleurodeles waltl TaxID=8319 RepID=A0AAV7P690_PLEWA|nr:hypothetical protein NDU88_009334 [Pleurodeles waltl]